MEHHSFIGSPGVGVNSMANTHKFYPNFKNHARNAIGILKLVMLIYWYRLNLRGAVVSW